MIDVGGDGRAHLGVPARRPYFESVVISSNEKAHLTKCLHRWLARAMSLIRGDLRSNCAVAWSPTLCIPAIFAETLPVGACGRSPGVRQVSRAKIERGDSIFRSAVYLCPTHKSLYQGKESEASRIRCLRRAPGRPAMPIANSLHVTPASYF